MSSPDPLSSAAVWTATLPASLSDELTRSDPPDLSADVLIVGGGLIGLATAYYLTERNVRVQLIDAAPTLASGASGANFGGVWPNEQGFAHPAGFQELAFLSRDLWGRLSLKPGFECDWRVNGFLQLNPDRFSPSAQEFATSAQAQGYAVTAVDGEQIAALEPALRPGLTAGLHYPSDAQVHPVKAAASLARLVRKKQGRITLEMPATSVQIADGKVTGVVARNATFHPRHVVVATSWQTDWLSACLPRPLPIAPVSGQLVATGPIPKLLKSAIANKYLVMQLKSGEIVTGGNLVPGVQQQADGATSQAMIAAARELVPALRDVPFVAAWCGVRPSTPDAMPLVGPLAAAPNVWLNCGHFRNGVVLAPACGKLLADWLIDGTSPAELACCEPSRFAVK